MLTYFLLVLLLIFGGVAPVAEAPAAQVSSDTCGDIQVYLQDLDQILFEEMQSYFENDDWIADWDQMVSLAAVDDVGVLALSEEEMQPFIDIMTVPGEVLQKDPAEDISGLVLPLYDSALDYWTILPEMMRKIANEGSSAGMWFIADLANAGSDNFMARENLKASCPQLVDEMTSGSGYIFFSEGVKSAGPLEREEFDSNNLTGLGFAILTMPAEDAN